MRELTQFDKNLVEKYSYLVPYIYNRKISYLTDVEPYREEILSEGYNALCVASTYFSTAVKEDPFSYLFRSIENAMRTFVIDFIWKSNNDLSLDAPLDNDSDTPLLELIESNYNEALLPNYIDDIMAEYIAQVMNDSSLSTRSKNMHFRPAYQARLYHILRMLSQGYNGEEIGIALGVSRQVINICIHRIRAMLENSSYRID